MSIIVDNRHKKFVLFKTFSLSIDTLNDFLNINIKLQIKIEIYAKISRIFNNKVNL